jgi:hypothetical protein
MGEPDALEWRLQSDQFREEILKGNGDSGEIGVGMI